MPAKDPGERVLAARIAAATRWAREPDRHAATAAARTGLLRSFERQADPDGTLSQAERARRAESLMAAHMARMSLKAARARRRRREADEELATAEAALSELVDGGPGDAA